MVPVRCVAVAAACACVIAAQEQRPVFRGGTNVVPLTVVVVDRRGAPVADLSETDFTVFEDGRPRQILSFFTQALGPRPVASQAVVNRTAAAGDGVAPATRRAFAITLATGRIQYPTRALDGAASFVRDRVLPQDVVAVLALGRASDFTANHNDTARLIDRYKQDHERIFFLISQWFAKYPGAPLPPEIEAEMDSVFSGKPIEVAGKPYGTDDSPGRPARGFRRSESLLLGMNEPHETRNERPWDRLATFEDVQRTAERLGRRVSQLMFGSTMVTYAAIEYLSRVDGDRHLIHIGPGLYTRSVEEDHRLARRANNARVAIDIIRTTGAPPMRPPPVGAPVAGMSGPPLRRLLEIGGFERIAELTGGYYTGNYLAADALATIDRQSRMSYLLGYAPSSSKPDGSYRAINVKVNRPGVTVRFQHGYHAVEQMEPLALRDLVVASRMEAAGSFGDSVNDIKIEIRDVRSRPRIGGGVELTMDLWIDTTRLALADRAAGKAAEIELAVYIGDDKEAPIGQVAGPITIDCDASTCDALVRDGASRTIRVAAAGVAKHIKVVAYDFGSDRLGSTVVSVK